MAEHPSVLPSPAIFALGIEGVLNKCQAASGRIEVISREPNSSRSTVPCERIICQEEGGRLHRLFCKFGQADDMPGPNHRLGVDYEAGVYERVLCHSRAVLPRFYGSFTDPTTGVVCLVLEWLDHAVPLILAPDTTSALRLAAQWLAGFHAEYQSTPQDRWTPYLAHYDKTYYEGWAQRVAEFSRPLHGRHPWLPQLCQRASDCFQHLLQAPSTVIHGECYATNWLVRPEMVFAIDWESAARAAGAIDVASLVWGWNGEETRECISTYQRARWPQGVPAAFEQQLIAARLYLALRWLGDCPDWTTAPDPPVSFEELKQIGEQAGLLKPHVRPTAMTACARKDVGPIAHEL